MHRYWIYNGTLYSEAKAQQRPYVRRKGLAIWAATHAAAIRQLTILQQEQVSDPRLYRNGPGAVSSS